MISIAAVPDILASYVGKPTVTDKGLSDVQTTDVTALCPCISFIAEYSYSNDVSIDEIDMNGDVVDGSEIADPIFGLTVAPVISFVKEVSIADTGLDTTAGQPSFALLCSAFSYIPTNFVSLQVYFNTKRVLGISTEVICNVETHIVRYQFINIYKDNPIEGGLDGVLVSSGDASEPINVTLDADNNETKIFKLAVRCVEGYHSVGDVVISDNSNRWSFSLAEDGAFADSITVSAVDSVNSIFWAKASCTETDSPSTDTAVAISVNASVRSTDSTVVLMHFDQPDVLKDECGNQWSGSNDFGYELVKVEDEWGYYYERDSSRPCTGVWGNSILLDQSSGMYAENLVLGGQDFTVDFWFKLDTSNLDEWFDEYGFNFPTFEIGFSFIDANWEMYPFLITEQFPVTVYFGSAWGDGERTWVRNQYYPDFESIEDVQSYAVWHHYAFVYIHEQKTVRAFVDGQLSFIEVLNDPINRSVGEIDLGPYDSEHCYMGGYFDELRVVDGVAVWTENFTPPTQPYSLQTTVNIEILCDTAITITKTEEEPAEHEKDHISVIELYDIHLRTGTVYVCNVDVDITFEGNKYLAIPIEREDISRSVDNVDDDMKITMADATTDQLKFIIAGFDFRGCFVRVRQIIYPDSLLDNSIQRDCFYGYIDNPAYENGEFSCTLRSRIPKIIVPRRTYRDAA